MGKNIGKKFLSDLKLHSDYLKWLDEENRYETWDDAAKDIVNGHRIKYQNTELNLMLDRVEESIKVMRILASQRNLQYRHKQITRSNLRMYNCLGKETKFITDKGVFDFTEVSENQEVNVWTHKGRWKKAIVKKYGKQKLNKITFNNRGNEQIVRATENHRWILNDESVTTNLKKGDSIIKSKPICIFDYDNAEPFEKLYWCYGYVFGDGTKVKDKNGIYKHSMVRLCGNQIKYAYRFEEMGFTSSSCLSIKGDVIFYTGKYLKTLPDLENEENIMIQAFLNGYLDADAEKNNNPNAKIYNNIQSSTEDNIEFLRKTLPVAGFFILNEKDLTGQETNFGIRPKTSKFTITNILGGNYEKAYNVKSIEEDIEEEVWCLEVEDDESFTLYNGLVTGNCTSTHANRNSVFQEVFYLALNGCGVGVGLLKPFVNNISAIQKRDKGTKTYIIQDTIEGWADALGVLMSSYFVDKQTFPEYAGYEVKFDGSLVREKGSFISGGFKAPGYEPLKTALEKIEQLIENWLSKEGNKLRPIAVGDIICHSSNAVLSGGVRRAALDFIVDPNDEEMIMSKTGNWYSENKHRERTNNSVILLRRYVTKEQFERLVYLNDGQNDIGFALANSWFDMFNPCFEISKLPILWEELRDLSTIEYDELEQFTKDNEDKFGVQGCNLNEIVAENIKSEEEFYIACEDSAILGTCQAGYTSFPYLGKVSEQIFEKEALLGISVIGWMNNPKLFNPEWLQKGAKIVIETNKKVAALIGINQAARTTCVKPGGNSGVVAMTEGGMKAAEAIEQFRCMQINKENTVAKWLAEFRPYMIEESVHSDSKTDYVVYVPIVNPKDAILKRDILGVKHLELIKLVQENWVIPGTVPELCGYKGINHNVSCTVILGEGDKEKCAEYIWENKNSFTAISFLSDFGSREWNQAPNTEIVPLEEIMSKYGTGALFASGLIVDGLHYFEDDLWKACKSVKDKNEPITGNREQVLLKKYWITRAKKFAKNYFKGNIDNMIYCLKDVYILHKWETINKLFKDVDLSKILTKPEYKDISDYASIACAGGACTI